MRLEATKQNNIPVLKLIGHFEADEIAPVKTWIENTVSTEQPNAIVDMAAVVFIDSSGLAVLVRGMKACRNNGGDLYLSHLHQTVRTIFELTGLYKVFRIYSTLEEAVQAVSS